MKPYLELKVVKVKKENLSLPYCPICSMSINKCAYYKKVQRKKAERAYKEGKWFGSNWVNGENLDKIKFPCLCSYVYMNVKRFGELRIVADGKYGSIYTIFNLRQMKTTSGWSVREFTLKAIIENYNVHILKGKIILFEEE